MCGKCLVPGPDRLSVPALSLPLGSPQKCHPLHAVISSPTKTGLRAPTYSPNWAWGGGARQFPGLEEPHIRKMLSEQVNEHWPLYLSVRDTQTRRANILLKTYQPGF